VSFRDFARSYRLDKHLRQIPSRVLPLYAQEWRRFQGIWPQLRQSTIRKKIDYGLMPYIWTETGRTLADFVHAKGTAKVSMHGARGDVRFIRHYDSEKLAINQEIRPWPKITNSPIMLRALWDLLIGAFQSYGLPMERMKAMSQGIVQKSIEPYSGEEGDYEMDKIPYRFPLKKYDGSPWYTRRRKRAMMSALASKEFKSRYYGGKK